MKLKKIEIKDRSFDRRTVFLRVDLNVPMLKGRIREDFKIRQTLPSIDFWRQRNCKIILASHLGQPDGSYNPNYSLAPVARNLSRLLAVKVNFLDYRKYSDWSDIKRKIESGQGIFLLDNLRFWPGEEKNSQDFGRRLAALAEIYVNDAFAVSHRANASVSAIRKYLSPAYRGLLLEQELESLNKILKPKKPFVLLMGGAKISTKAPIIEKLYPLASQILLGGALANDFYLARGLNVGRSLVDRKGLKIARKLLAAKKIILPLDAIVESRVRGKSLVKVKKINEIGRSDKILDIGPDSILLFAKYIKRAQTIVWNGPMGQFEDERFRKGSVVIARTIAARAGGRAFGVAGGGETIEALNLSGLAQYMDWVSTGGGAMLAYLSGEAMPGLN